VDGLWCWWIETVRSKFYKILVRVRRVGAFHKTKLLVALCLGLMAPVNQQAHAQSAGTARVFVLTSTYGVMAGSLTGLASLAFYESPSDNLRNVAMGASIGLYVGLLLGTYIVFFGPSSQKSAGQGSEASSGLLAGLYPTLDPNQNWGLGWRLSF